MKYFPLVLIPAALISACSPSRESARETPATGAGDTPGRFESDFRPSDHDTLAARSTNAGAVPPAQEREIPGNPAQGTAEEELVPGFRVQIFSATDIDAAKGKKLEAEADFPSEWFYLVYDPPAYKIRGGNFLQRYEAERFVKLAAEKGFTDSWAVPEKVFRQPPPPSR
jgi:hypothetical protein